MNAGEDTKPRDRTRSCAGDRPVREHLLLTVLGTNPREARYVLEGREVRAKLAPIALLGVLPETERPDRVLALCTPEAKLRSWPLFKEVLDDRVSIEPVEIPAGDAQKDINVFLETVAGTIGADVDLTVDVTHGFRHFSFLTYVAVLYLAALREVRVRGAYYGLLRDGLSPFLDLRPLLDLPRWVHALEVLRDTGSAFPMAKILDDGPASQPARDNARDLTHLSEAYLSGLPLELGWQASNVREHRRKPLMRLLRDDHHLPLAKTLVEGLGEILEPFAIAAPASGDAWKQCIQLTRNELQRQARIIDDLIRHENFATALRLMREWIVSWVIYHQAPEDAWLDRDVRHKAEGLLHAFRAIASDCELRDVLTEEQRALGRFWDQLAEIRNAYAHHGMRGDDLVRNGKIASTRGRVLSFWKEALRCCPAITLSLGESPGGRILISPIGKRPGVLFSAVQAVRAQGNGEDPALCLVICSDETRGIIAEALEKTGFENDFKPLMFEDAFGGGPHEIERLVSTARGHLVGAGEVLVNVTGGTTLMGLAAERLASEARSLACPAVRRFGLIDRRPPSRQETDPYQTGEPFWLDADEDGDAGGD